ncbi:hypothetical protein ACI2LV_13115 [Streptomyces fungicidicus]|uniref:hypothetical protein n=1 Tax=Streptomyces fungicidicus TaxID=68203 RepID=UPI00384F796E
MTRHGYTEKQAPAETAAANHSGVPMRRHPHQVPENQGSRETEPVSARSATSVGCQPGCVQQPSADKQPLHGHGGTAPLLSLRSAIILLLGAFAATGAGVLTYLAQRDTATAALAGGTAFAGAVLFFHSVVSS